MTISQNEVSYSQWTGNNVTTKFDYEFKITNEADLLVVVTDAAGVDTTQVLGTDYTVSGVQNNIGGQVTMTTAVASGSLITLSDNVPISQDTPFQNQSQFFALSHENAFDKLTRLVLRAFNGLARRISTPSTDPDSVNLELPAAVDRANKIFSFGAAGEVIASDTLPGSTVFDQSTVGQKLWPQTTEESTAGVTPTYYYYEPGNVLRYGADPTNPATDDRAAFVAALDSYSQADVPPGEDYRVNTPIELADGQRIVCPQPVVSDYSPTNEGAQIYAPTGFITGPESRIDIYLHGLVIRGKSDKADESTFVAYNGIECGTTSSSGLGGMIEYCSIKGFTDGINSGKLGYYLDVRDTWFTGCDRCIYDGTPNGSTFKRNYFGAYRIAIDLWAAWDDKTSPANAGEQGVATLIEQNRCNIGSAISTDSVFKIGTNHFRCYGNYIEAYSDTSEAVVEILVNRFAYTPWEFCYNQMNVFGQNIRRGLQTYGYDSLAGIRTIRAKGIIVGNNFAGFLQEPVLFEARAALGSNATDIGRDIQVENNRAGHQAWRASNAYIVDDEVTNGGNLYICTIAGTSASSGGPTGTGTGIADGPDTLEWNYVSVAPAQREKYVKYNDERQIPSQQRLAVGDSATFNVTAAKNTCPIVEDTSENLGGKFTSSYWSCRYTGVYWVTALYTLVTAPSADREVSFHFENPVGTIIHTEVHHVDASSTAVTYKAQAMLRMEADGLIRLTTQNGDASCQMALTRFEAVFMHDDPFTL